MSEPIQEPVTEDVKQPLAGLNRRSARVRPEDERVELYLLPSQKPPGAIEDTSDIPPAPLSLSRSRTTLYQWKARTDAELRLFIEDEMVLQVKQDFGNVKFSDELLHRLAAKTIEHIQVEADLNIERLKQGEQTMDPQVLADRVALMAFRYDRFLRSLKQVEDAEYEMLRRRELQDLATARAVDKVTSSQVSPDEKLPTNLVEHLLRVGMEQHLKVIRKHLVGDDEAFGVTVTFKDLSVTRKVSSAALIDESEMNKPRGKIRSILRPAGHRTVWTASANLMFGCCFAIGDKIRETRSQKHDIHLLKPLNGVIPSGKATLVLGAPHSGKTQLLHAISGQTKTGGRIKVNGNVYYNGHNSRTVHTPNVCTMVEQIDIHIPTLTVRETLTFAFMCRGKSRAPTKEMRQKADNLFKTKVDLIMAVLGLTRVADTIIGNEAIKGISGGEMRRVTLGEMLVVGSKVLLLDEISTGLDSAATFDITKSIRALCKVFNTTALVALLQPPPETFELFDDVILMGNGNIMYHGPQAQIKAYFENIGIAAQPGMDFADFAIEASLDDAQKLLDAYKVSEGYQKELEVLAQDPETLHTARQMPESKMAIQMEQQMMTAGKFNRPMHELFAIVIRRQWMIMIRNKPFIFARLAQNIVMGLLLGALYFSIPFSEYYLVAMMLSQILSLAGFSTVALLGTVLAVRNTYYKQSKQNFFPPIVYVMADYVVGLPFSLMDAFLLGSISYFMAGLSVSPNGQPYFVFLVIFVSFGVCMAVIIRLFAYASPNQNVAFSSAVFFNVFNLIFAGAIATPNVIPPYFIWIYWGLSPTAWAYRSLLQNEFYSVDYENECGTGCPNNELGQCVDYCAAGTNCPEPFPNMTCGEYFLTARQVETGRFFLWLGAGMLWVYTALFVFLSVLALKYLRWDAPGLTSIQEDQAAIAKEKEDEETDAVENDLEMQQSMKATGELAKGFVPRPLIWRDIVYTIQIIPKEQPGEHRPRRLKRPPLDQVDLLKDITGFAKPFTLTALMGSSGAGKTTLLDCLCFRKTVGKITGTVSLGSRKVVPALFKKEVGYVEQFGVHSAMATVKESVEFSARLRLGNEYSLADRTRIIESTLDLLGLRPIENSLIGIMGDPDALSFEENKRVTIAVELVANPAVCFADEPTSGLTSKEARVTMKALARVAQSGRPVICTIHQPSAYIFGLFHRLLLLKRGGEVVFFGDLGKNASNMVKYFEGIPGVTPLPAGLNPATWMLDVIGAGVGRADKNGFDFAELYRSSDLCRHNMDELEHMLTDCQQQEQRESDAKTNVPGAEGAAQAVEPPTRDSTMMIGDEEKPKGHIFNDERVRLLPQEEAQKQQLQQKYKASYGAQFTSLMGRNNLEYWRTPSYSLLRWVVMIIFALVTGFTFFQQQMATAAGTQSRVAVINLMLLLTANYNSATIVPFAFSRKALFYREKASGMYASFLYAITLQFVEEPYIFFEVVFTVVIFYFLVGMSMSAGAFFYYLFMMYFFVTFATYMGLMWSQALGVQGAASLISSLVVQLMVLFSGVALPGNVMPSWLLGGYYISPVRWAMEGLLASQFSSYTQVICNTAGQVYTWTDGMSVNANCPVGDNGQQVWFHLSDVNVNACCNPLPNRPISAKAYVFTGYTYSDGFVTPPWLGGNNGYHLDWQGFDFLFVIMAGLVVRIIAIVLTQYVSHQLR